MAHSFRIIMAAAFALALLGSPAVSAAQAPPGGREALFELKREAGAFSAVIQRYSRELPARKMSFADANFEFSRRLAPHAESILASLRSVLLRYPGNARTQIEFARESQDVLRTLDLALFEAERLFAVAKDLRGSAHPDVLRLQRAIVAFRVQQANHFVGGEAALLDRMRGEPDGLRAAYFASSAYSGIAEKDWPPAVRALRERRLAENRAAVRAAEQRKAQAAATAKLAAYRNMPDAYEPLWLQNKLRNPDLFLHVIERKYEKVGPANRFRRFSIANLFDNNGILDAADYLSANAQALRVLCPAYRKIPKINDKFHFFLTDDGRLTNFHEDRPIVEAAMADARAVVAQVGCRGALDWATTMAAYGEWGRRQMGLN